jgi:transcriptional regulator with XRE-family HTH domain
MIAAEQIRAARALLKWRAQDLANRTGLTLRTIQRFENEVGIPSSRTKNLMTIRQALEDAGVIFIDRNEDGGPGVRLK